MAGAVDAKQPLAACPECGQAWRDGTDCRAAFGRLLALEFEVPAAFAAHHLTVATFYLQHPAGHGPDILAMWRTLVAETLDGRTAPAEFRRRTRQRFEGAVRVRAEDARPPSWWPRRYPLSVLDAVGTGESRDPRAHVARVREWAAAVRATLDDAELANRQARQVR